MSYEKAQATYSQRQSLDSVFRKTDNEFEKLKDAYMRAVANNDNNDV